MTRKKEPMAPARFELTTKRTYETAKVIVDAESQERSDKVQRLRKARMEREASGAATLAAVKASPRRG
ncbi:hypothetical protein [Tropicimonas sp. IMCC34043]|uniref:hypothetical protein n=1 Tax=Tropicimonas sp. IMCC34043 TaxID=2248760 RepID=UPI000E257C8B|nr:hypothetical protein [Tropicimonas sp. IMCC34043]